MLTFAKEVLRQVSFGRPVAVGLARNGASVGVAIITGVVPNLPELARAKQPQKKRP